MPSKRGGLGICNLRQLLAGRRVDRQQHAAQATFQSTERIVRLQNVRRTGGKQRVAGQRHGFDAHRKVLLPDGRRAASEAGSFVHLHREIVVPIR